MATYSGTSPATRNVSERRTIGHEGARPRSGATESASTPARRCAAREDAPPPVPRRRRLAKDVYVFVTVDAPVRRAPPGGELLDERQARRARLAQLDDPGVRLEGIREGLPLPERDVGATRGVASPGARRFDACSCGRRAPPRGPPKSSKRPFGRKYSLDTQQVVSSPMPTRSGASGPRGRAPMLRRYRFARRQAVPSQRACRTTSPTVAGAERASRPRTASRSPRGKSPRTIGSTLRRVRPSGPLRRSAPAAVGATRGGSPRRRARPSGPLQRGGSA